MYGDAEVTTRPLPQPETETKTTANTSAQQMLVHRDLRISQKHGKRKRAVVGILADGRSVIVVLPLPETEGGEKLHEYPAGKPETQRSDTVPFQLPTAPMLMGTAIMEPPEMATN
jgi:hypothetical protein